jgi:glycosyltransferase involved in cell wall biosynthesis
VLEAMAWGLLPVVATPLAIEGLQLENGVHVSAAENARVFVSAICDLCENSTLYESRRLAARRHVISNFGPEVFRRAVHAGLHLACDRKGCYASLQVIYPGITSAVG